MECNMYLNFLIKNCLGPEMVSKELQNFSQIYDSIVSKSIESGQKQFSCATPLPPHKFTSESNVFSYLHGEYTQRNKMDISLQLFHRRSKGWVLKITKSGHLCGSGIFIQFLLQIIHKKLSYSVYIHPIYYLKKIQAQCFHLGCGNCI